MVEIVDRKLMRAERVGKETAFVLRRLLVNYIHPAWFCLGKNHSLASTRRVVQETPRLHLP